MNSITTILVVLFGVFALSRGHPVVEHDVDDDTPAMQEIFDQNKGQFNELSFIDVKMPPMERHPDGTQGAIIKKSSGRLWENKMVHYSFHSAFNAELRRKVRSALDKIEAVTCIRFKEFPLGEAPGHFVRIISDSGCWSYIGKTPFRGQKHQDMSLRIGGCVHDKIIQHEFIHALGAFHEQSRPDRDSYLTLLKENMVDGAWRQFEKQGGNVDSLDVAYDAESIMHYSGYAFSKNGQPTMKWKADPRKKLGGSKLSDKDILQLNKLYSCDIEPPTPTTTTTTTPMTTTTTPMTTTTTKKPPKGCVNKENYCQYIQKFLCDDARVVRDCPKLCNDKCDPMTTTTTPMTTESTTPMTTTSTTETTSSYHCQDVSSRCSSPSCGRSIYKMRCRKSCGLCNTPLPGQCKGKEDSDRAKCAMYAKQGKCSSYDVRDMCKASCCLRGGR